MKFFSSFVCLTILVSIQFASAMFIGIPGGLSDISVDEVKQYIPKIESFYNSKTNDQNYAMVAKLISAQSQVVAGTRYAIKFNLSKTNCEKVQMTNGSKTNKDCKQTETVANCVADVIVRLWEHYEEVTEMKCNDVITSFYT